jgi:uncharacterized membrane protein YhaH (DUF805 family)
MFKKPFSFDGRIRRLEFGLSYLIYFAYAFIAGGIGGLFGFIDDSDSTQNNLLIWLILSPALVFLIFQGAKRCHDRNNSGWWQIIPFYGFWMLFADGDIGPNDYGDNPKGLNYYYDETDDNNSSATPIDDVDEDGIK